LFPAASYWQLDTIGGARQKPALMTLRKRSHAPVTIKSQREGQSSGSPISICANRARTKIHALGIKSWARQNQNLAKKPGEISKLMGPHKTFWE
jgi:hypothetical protein